MRRSHQPAATNHRKQNVAPTENPPLRQNPPSSKSLRMTPKRTLSHSATRPSFVAARSQGVSLSALTLMGGGIGGSRDPIVANGACYGDASER
jgi:hypothetical protein